MTEHDKEQSAYLLKVFELQMEKAKKGAGEAEEYMSRVRLENTAAIAVSEWLNLAHFHVSELEGIMRRLEAQMDT